ncbi:MAG: tRNA lysidine(34) synthetase TilS [candidate division Zixibacteria bacterium]|nr:tRNA lysidine(34) synthetase TilS [candidate division Zixibacteria bacterium]
MLNNILLANERFDLFRQGDRVLIALSGGPDSVALLHLLGLLQHQWNLTIAVAHVNHCLREEAAGDQRFCRVLSRANGYKFHSKKVDIPVRAKKLKIGFEQAGREARYGFFQRLCEKFDYTRIATAHTADDSAETFLLNLIRGANFGGLGGIPPKRNNIIRPLIESPKAEILEFLKLNGLSYRIDESNRDNTQSRNLIRNKIIPVLRNINAKASRHIARAGRDISIGYGFLEDEVEKLYQKCLVNESNTQITLDLEKLPTYYDSLRSWILLRAYFHLTDDNKRPDSTKIERAVNLSRRGAVTLLGSGIIVSNHAGKLILCRPLEQVKRIRLRRNSKTKLTDSGLAIQVEIIDGFSVKDIEKGNDESIAFLDNDKVSKLTVRGFIEGDKFQPLGMRGTKKVADYLNDKGVPLVFKKSIPIVLSNDDIIWIAGYGIAEKFKVTVKTSKVLKIQMLRDMVINESTYF